MDFYYSASANRFYATGLVSPEELPTDAVKISEEYRMKLLVELTEDKQIIGDGQGLPILVDKKYNWEDAQAIVLARLNNYHRVRVNRRISFGEYSLSISDESVKDLMAAAQAAAFLPDEPIVLKVGEVVYQMELEKFQELVRNVVAANRQGSKVFANHRDTIKALTDASAVIKYDYKAGWPE